MKKKDKVAIKTSEFVVVLIILTSAYFLYFQFSQVEDEPAKIETVSKNIKQQPQDEISPLKTSETQIVSETLNQENNRATLSEHDTASDPSLIAKKELDPVVLKMKAHSQFIHQKHEQRLRDILKRDGQEKLMDTYLALKQERILKIYNQLKITKSRNANVKINFEFHDKLYQSFGKDLYIKYLEELKLTNDEAKSTKIKLEF